MERTDFRLNFKTQNFYPESRAKLFWQLIISHFTPFNCQLTERRVH